MEISVPPFAIWLLDPANTAAGRAMSGATAATSPIAEIPRKLLREVWFVIKTSAHAEFFLTGTLLVRLVPTNRKRTVIPSEISIESTAIRHWHHLVRGRGLPFSAGMSPS